MREWKGEGADSARRRQRDRPGSTFGDDQVSSETDKHLGAEEAVTPNHAEFEDPKATASTAVEQAVHQMLTAHNEPMDAVLTHCLIITQAVQYNEAGETVHRRGCWYPLGVIDPTMKIGLLHRALRDAELDDGA